MRIPDDLVKCVGFVSPMAQELTFVGTAFIVGIQMDMTRGFAHLVTAKHVAEAIEPGETVIAVNAKDGMPRYVHTGQNHWFYHPTEANSVDVAVLPFGSANFSEYDITWIPEQIFASEKRISEWGIGLGDEIIIIGLFTKFFGASHLIPLVRTGNIAMMPKDRVPVRDFGPMEAYLAEGRSIGGLSGSPVFVRSTFNIPGKTQRGEIAQVAGLGPFHFLGLMHGHWDLPTSFSEAQQTEAVNMGVSIIVPAHKILEVLYHPELVTMRKEHLARENQSNLPTADIVKKPFAKGDFETALRKATRKLRTKRTK